MTNSDKYSVYNPVEVKPNEVLGSLFLGILSIILLIALLRSQRQLLRLQERLIMQDSTEPDGA
jgi:hypothetical protein